MKKDKLNYSYFVVWEEMKHGKYKGEFGSMLVQFETEEKAVEWARERKMENFAIRLMKCETTFWTK